MKIYSGNQYYSLTKSKDREIVEFMVGSYRPSELQMTGSPGKYSFVSPEGGNHPEVRRRDGLTLLIRITHSLSLQARNFFSKLIKFGVMCVSFLVGCNCGGRTFDVSSCSYVSVRQCLQYCLLKNKFLQAASCYYCKWNM